MTFILNFEFQIQFTHRHSGILLRIQNSLPHEWWQAIPAKMPQNRSNPKVYFGLIHPKNNLLDFLYNLQQTVHRQQCSFWRTMVFYLQSCNAHACCFGFFWWTQTLTSVNARKTFGDLEVTLGSFATLRHIICTVWWSTTPDKLFLWGNQTLIYVL